MNPKKFKLIWSEWARNVKVKGSWDNWTNEI